jgi:hypothetical protein
MVKTVFNPFEKYSEIRLFVFGLVLTVAGSWAAYYFNGRFDGAIDYHFRPDVKITEPLLDNAINTLSLFLFLFLLAKIINSKTRIIDILNTVLIARIPFYLLPFFNAGGTLAKAIDTLDVNNPSAIQASPALTLVLLMGFAAIGFLVWFVILLYNGFKIASNSKKNIHKVYFAIAILAAELLATNLIFLTETTQS